MSQHIVDAQVRRVRKISFDKKGKLAVIVFFAMSAVLTISIFVGGAKATPGVPTVTPSGGNPVNVIWRGNGYAALTAAQMIDFGWCIGDQLPDHGAFAMLMWQDGAWHDAKRWYMWIYEGGWDADWGYWSYASVGHYHFDSNPFHFGWYVDDWEGAQNKVHLQWTGESTPWESVDVELYNLGNSGYYYDVWNGGYATIVDISHSASVEGTLEWTTNSRFLDNPANKWDKLAYKWDWNLFDVRYQGNTWEVSNTDTHYAIWDQDGVVKLSAEDYDIFNTHGTAARVTYGPFINYPFDPPPPIPINKATSAWIMAVVSNYGSDDSGIFAWTGIKFDAWFKDPDNDNREMMVEMYFAGTGLQEWGWGDEHWRTCAGGTLDDYLIKLQAWPQYAQIIGDKPPDLWTPGSWKSTVFLLDLKSIYQKAAGGFDRSVNDLLYAVALDMESGGHPASAAGHVWAQANEIRVTYTDTTPPSNPTGWSSGSHSLWTWSTDNTIDISWSGASDDLSGVAGYSIDWTTSSSTIPDTNPDTTGRSATSPSLASGSNWYFHVRTQDNAGNWATNAYHVGPFYIDTTPPSNPTGWSSSHAQWIWSNDNTVDISWSGASDAQSGVYGYSFAWDTSSTAIPDTTPDTTGTSTTSPALATGNSWYFHLRTRDNVGNWNPGAFHIGPFYVDTVAPSNPTAWSSSHTIETWSTDHTIDMSWTGASDEHSGVYGYSYAWDTSSSTIPDTDEDTTGTSTTSPGLASGNSWYFHVRTRDKVGNWAPDALHVGPFYINTRPNIPSTPSGTTSGSAHITYSYSTCTTDPEEDSVRYEFNWDDGSQNTMTEWNSSGTPATASHHWNSAGTYDVKVRAQDSKDAWSDWSQPLSVNIASGGSGCPIISVYDGSEFISEGLLDIHNPDGLDVTSYHSLTTTLQPFRRAYLIRLTEHPQTSSRIDNVRLYAILEDQTWIELQLISARHSEDGNVLPMLRVSDDWKTETKGANYNNGTSQSIELRFVALPSHLNPVTFVFVIEGNNIIEKCPY